MEDVLFKAYRCLMENWPNYKICMEKAFKFSAIKNKFNSFISLAKREKKKKKIWGVTIVLYTYL